RPTPYAELYTDLVRRCEAMLDTYPWLTNADGFRLDDALRQVRDAADKAVDEFDKVRRLQHEARQQVKSARKRCDEQFNELRRTGFKRLEDFVHHLAAIRKLRGELITLKEVRYIDLATVEKLEQQVAGENETLSGATVKFLLKPEALDPYRKEAAERLAAVDHVKKAAEGREIEKAVAKAGAELEMLIEIVNSLKIEDATETTRIIDGITAIYSTLNQVKAALKKRLKDLVAAEGAAQFAAQLKLLGQSAASYLDLCDTPAKCDDYLNRITVQLEELEGAFADFEEYTVQLAGRRTELYEAFEQRKVALVEQRNRRANALLTAAERILKVIQNRLAGFKTVEEINSYLAADLMPAKVRDTIAQLLELDDSVKADDLQGRLKSVQQEAVRQLKDRQELFVGGEGVIKLGRHHFNINTQPLDLTIVFRDDLPNLHLTGTKYFEPLTDEALLATREVWEQEVVSENRDVYRAEYLAWQLLKQLQDRSPSETEKRSDTHQADATTGTFQSFLQQPPEQQLARVQEFMGGRYQESYTKGVHDLDAALILRTLASVHVGLRRARHQPTVRACAVVWWHRFCPPEEKSLWTTRLGSFGARNQLFPGDPVQQRYIQALARQLTTFTRESGLFAESVADDAANYLFAELTSREGFCVTREANAIAAGFRSHLAAKGSETAFDAAQESLTKHPGSAFEMIRDWVRGFLLGQPGRTRFVDEAAALLFCGGDLTHEEVTQ
ncbi:MAG TPA: AAA family ATPase, partial [Verrucomicrobiales bacterium]|nr:AAA family ATPase [Verrucomicrobiales bacterium]